MKNSAVMVSVGEFIIDYDNQNNLQQTFQLNPYQKVTWPAGKAPKDSPECGFNGDKCNDASETVVNDKGELQSAVPSLLINVYLSVIDCFSYKV